MVIRKREETDIHKRMLELVGALHLQQGEFETECGLAPNFVNRITRNVRKKSLERIKARYPQVNINWIKTGNGGMFTQPETADTVGERLRMFAAFKGVSLTKMSTMIGMSQSALSAVRDNIRMGTLMKLKATFPDLNDQWMLNGVGDMTTDPTPLKLEGTIKDRLRLFVSYLGVSEQFFLHHCDISLNRISLLDDNFNPEMLDRIHEAYPDLNMKWVVKGEGKMILEAAKTGNVQMIPVVSQLAYAGYLGGYGDEEYISSLPTIPFVVSGRGKYVAFEVSGDSMDNDTPDAYKSGDILICKQLEMSLYRDSKLPYKKKDFVIIHKDGILIKRIIDHNIVAHTITIHSLNDDPAYPDKVLDLSDIRQLFTVEYSQRKRTR